MAADHVGTDYYMRNPVLQNKARGRNTYGRADSVDDIRSVSESGMVCDKHHTVADSRVTDLLFEKKEENIHEKYSVLGVIRPAQD